MDLKVTRFSAEQSMKQMSSLNEVTLEILGTFLSQNLSRGLPRSTSGRMLMINWLVFAFIVGAAYKGNLTAHLTLPKYPPRAETLEQLVKAADRVTGASYNGAFKEFFSKSNAEDYQKLADILDIGHGIAKGMELSLRNQRTAVFDTHMYMKHLMADKFTRPDGGSDLYLGRAILFPGQSAWAVPHNAPYTPNLDRVIQAAIETGLYEVWSSEVIDRSRRESMRRQREHQAKIGDVQSNIKSSDAASSTKILALTLEHMQGALFLLAIGWIISAMLFLIEMLKSSLDKT